MKEEKNDSIKEESKTGSQKSLNIQENKVIEDIIETSTEERKIKRRNFKYKTSRPNRREIEDEPDILNDNETKKYIRVSKKKGGTIRVLEKNFEEIKEKETNKNDIIDTTTNKNKNIINAKENNEIKNDIIDTTSEKNKYNRKINKFQTEINRKGKRKVIEDSPDILNENNKYIRMMGKKGGTIRVEEKKKNLEEIKEEVKEKESNNTDNKDIKIEENKFNRKNNKFQTEVIKRQIIKDEPDVLNDDFSNRLSRIIKKKGNTMRLFDKKENLESIKEEAKEENKAEIKKEINNNNELKNKENKLELENNTNNNIDNKSNKDENNKINEIKKEDNNDENEYDNDFVEKELSDINENDNPVNDIEIEKQNNINDNNKSIHEDLNNVEIKEENKNKIENNKDIKPELLNNKDINDDKNIIENTIKEEEKKDEGSNKILNNNDNENKNNNLLNTAVNPKISNFDPKAFKSVNLVQENDYENLLISKLYEQFSGNNPNELKTEEINNKNKNENNCKIETLKTFKTNDMNAKNEINFDIKCKEIQKFNQIIQTNNEEFSKIINNENFLYKNIPKQKASAEKKEINLEILPLKKKPTKKLKIAKEYILSINKNLKNNEDNKQNEDKKNVLKNIDKKEDINFRNKPNKVLEIKTENNNEDKDIKFVTITNFDLYKSTQINKYKNNNKNMFISIEDLKEKPYERLIIDSPKSLHAIHNSNWTIDELYYVPFERFVYSQKNLINEDIDTQKALYNKYEDKRIKKINRICKQREKYIEENEQLINKRYRSNSKDNNNNNIFFDEKIKEDNELSDLLKYELNNNLFNLKNKKQNNTFNFSNLTESNLNYDKKERLSFLLKKGITKNNLLQIKKEFSDNKEIKRIIDNFIKCKLKINDFYSNEIKKQTSFSSVKQNKSSNIIYNNTECTTYSNNYIDKEKRLLSIKNLNNEDISYKIYEFKQEQYRPILKLIEQEKKNEIIRNENLEKVSNPNEKKLLQRQYSKDRKKASLNIKNKQNLINKNIDRYRNQLIAESSNF